MKMKGLLTFRAIGTGKHRSKHLYVYINGSCVQLPAKAIAEFFPDLPRGCDACERKVNVEVTL